MNKLILSKKQVDELVRKNKYQVDEKTKWVSRYIDGRYLNNFQFSIFNFQKVKLPAMAVPGADAGELALVFAVAKSYGLTVNLEKTWESLVELVGGEKNLQFHTDEHADAHEVLGGCGHMKQIGIDPVAYDLSEDDVIFIKNKFSKVKQQEKTELVLHGHHQEGAVLFVTGRWGIYPSATVQTDEGEKNVQVFIVHQSFATERRKTFAQLLVKHGAVELPNKCDADYLSHALNEVGENHVMETAKRLAKGLPIFSVVFSENGEYTVEEMGAV